MKKNESAPSVIPSVVEESLKNQIAILEDQRLRVLADYQNLKKRTAAQMADMIEQANAGLLEKILPVIDNLERAYNHTNDNGVGNILKQLHLILEGEGLSIITSDGGDFDPHTMECVDVVPGPENKVVKTVSSGYLYHDKVLRPAKVEVGGGESAGDPEPVEGSSNSH